MTKSSDVWCVNGVVSFGVEGDCAQPRKPGVYTKVADSLEWIQQTTNGAFIYTTATHMSANLLRLT